MLSVLFRPGLASNRELNLAHMVLIDPGEAEDRNVAHAVAWLTDARPRIGNC